MLGGGRARPKIRPARRRDGGALSGELDFEESWGVLASCLLQIHTKNSSNLKFEEIYRRAHAIVLKKKGKELYEQIQGFERNWLANQVRTSLDNQTSPVLLSEPNDGGRVVSANERRTAGEAFLKGLKESFEDHQQIMKMSSDVFMYLDRVHCLEAHRPTIYAAAMVLFRDTILKSPPKSGGPATLDILVQTILDQIAMERDGDVIDKTLVKSCVIMLEGLSEPHRDGEEDQSLYDGSFEDFFLEASKLFYQKEAVRLMQTNDVVAYCKATNRRIQEEQDRCESTIADTTSAKITAVVEKELIENKIADLVVMETGVVQMIDNEKYKDLSLVYRLNARIDDQKTVLTQAIRDRVQELGTKINASASNSNANQVNGAQAGDGTMEGATEQKAKPARTAVQQTSVALHWVEQVLALRERYDRVWQDSFESDASIQPSLTRSFTDFINAMPRCSEYVSLFIDENMKKGLKDKTESEVDTVLDRAIALLRYIVDKDMFERYYKKHLCKRLLMGKSVSIDVEKQMISRMKIELGNSFTGKMEAMFKDMSVSEELTNGFKTRMSNNAADRRADLSIHVLTSMTWPLESMQSSKPDAEDSKVKCNYPAEIERIRKGFESFYAEKHSGRMLTWMPHMGSADVRVIFPGVEGESGRLAKERRHELNMPTYAMIICMLFNDVPAGGHLTFNDIQDKTSIPQEELIRNLQSLAVAPKTRILIKQPMSKDVKATDKFLFNEKFQSPYMKIKVSAVAASNKVEGERERRETERKNDASRGYVIEAAIVRIMKQRKESTHSQLVSETLSQLSAQFKPEVTMIKQRIESLIEREYLERIEDATPPAYRYLA